jgi:hypothetical protein
MKYTASRCAPSHHLVLTLDAGGFERYEYQRHGRTGSSGEKHQNWRAQSRDSDAGVARDAEHKLQLVAMAVLFRGLLFSSIRSVVCIPMEAQ